MGTNTGDALDMGKLRGMQKDIARKAGKGDGNLIYSGKLPEEMDVKILPPPVEAHGVYFLEQNGHWIDGKFYLSNSTEALGGGDDVIQDEIDAAKDSGDESLLALVNKKKDKIPVLKSETRYLIPVLQLEIEYSGDDVTGHKVVDDECKVLVAKPTLLTAINKVITSRPFQNGTKLGAADREKGAPIILSKTGKGINTEYGAMGWNQPLEIDEKYYTDKMLEQANVFEITRKMAKSDDYLRSVIRHYLYGEDIIEDEKEEKTEKSEKPAAAPATTGGGARPATGSARPSTGGARPSTGKAAKPAVTDDNAQDTKAAAAPPKGRSLLGDAAKVLDNLD